MSLKIGIVGLPNVGKSTLFNALLGTNLASASNFPFCTIEPNTGIVPVPDSRLDKLAEIEKSAKIVPATVEFVDIAGLVKGAATGQGLGNKFLSHIREVDAIIQVVRLFEDENVTHVTGNIYPQDDIDTINTELILADLEVIDKRLEKEEKLAKTDPKLKPKVSLMHRIKQHLEQEMPIRSLGLNSDDEKTWIKEFQLLTQKPVMYIANLDDEQIKDENVLKPLEAILEQENTQVIGINAKTEAEITQLEKDEKQEFLQDLGLQEPSLNKVIQAGYALLGLITYLTAGPQETRGWTVKKGAKAPEAAGVIHTDFERGFIRAEVVAFDDFVTHNGWVGARNAGKVGSEGKEYIVKDGDVILFRFNV
jgi:hypothetical protein